MHHKRTRCLFGALLLVLPSGISRAQDDPQADIPYVYTLGGAGFDKGVDVGLDAEGNAYFIGEFDGTFDFDPGTDTATLSSRQRDIYVASYDRAGAFRFVIQIGNALGSSEAAGGIAVADEGHFVVTGSQTFGEIDYDPDPAVSEMRTGELFIAGYKADGSFRFAVTPTASGSAASGKGNAVALDDAGNVYAAGTFVDTLNFDPEGIDAALLGAAGGSDIFVAGYDAHGVYRFAFRLGGTDSDEGLGIAVDGQQNVYVTGSIRGEVAFDPDDTDGDGDLEVREGGASGSAFLAGYEADGTFRFAYHLGNDGAGYDLAVDDADNVTLVGAFRGTIAFDPEDADGGGSSAEHTVGEGQHAFVAGYASDGSYRFGAIPVGTSEALSVATLPQGDIFVTGSFGGEVDFDHRSAVTLLDAGSGTDVFVARYDPGGGFDRVFSLDSNGLNSGLGLAIDPVSLLLTGHFTSTTDFDPGEATNEHSRSGQYDLFMAKYLAGYLPVEVEEPPLTLQDAVLSAPYPNPFAGPTRLRLSASHRQHVTVSVYDTAGRRIAVLHERTVDPQTPIELVWNAGHVAPGLYLVRAEGESFRATQPLVLVR